MKDTMAKKKIFHYPALIMGIFLCIQLLTACDGGEEKAPPEVQLAPSMKVVRATTRDMPYWGEFIGQISAVDSVDVRARVAGFLQEKRFKEGLHVKKGDLLFIIDPKPFEEDLNVALSGLEYNQALLAKAKKDFDRFQKLLEEGVVSQDEFEGYQTDFDTYQAKVRESNAQVENARIQLGYTKIYSPIDGVIGRAQVDIGNLVGQNESTLLATISTVDPVYVSFSVSESEYVRAKKGQLGEKPPKNSIKLILADGEEYDQSGSFSMVDRAIDSQTGTLGIRVSFPNPSGLLRPGQYGKIRVLMDMAKEAIVIPVRGILDVQGMKSVYLVTNEGTIVNQPVTLGFEVNGLVVIKSGLKADDQIIVDGINRVRPGMTVTPEVVPLDETPKDSAHEGETTERTETTRKDG